MIGIVTVNWNGYDVTTRLVDQVLNNTIQDYRLVVINNSPDEADRFSQNCIFRDSRIEVIDSAENVGYAGGLNLGLKALSNVEEITHYLLLNNDIEIEPDFIQMMLEYGEDHNRIYSPLILQRDSGLVQNSGGKISLWVGGGINLNKNVPIEEIRKQPPDFLSGCALFMHRSIVERVGLFDEIYGSYFEDADYCFRAKNLGIGIDVLWEVMIRHFHSYSTQKDSDYKTFLLNRNQILFAKRHLSKLNRNVFMLGAVSRGIVLAILRRRIRPFYRGVLEGFFL